MRDLPILVWSSPRKTLMRSGWAKIPGPPLARTAPCAEVDHAPPTLFEKTARRDFIQLQPRVSMARSTALGRIARDVQKIIFFHTLRTNVRWARRCEKVAARSTSKISQTALRTDIPHKFSWGCMATQCTCILVCPLFHLTYLIHPVIRLRADLPISPGGQFCVNEKRCPFF